MRVVVLLLALATTGARPSCAFSVLAHQGIVDTSWNDTIVSAIRRRFPRATADEVERAHAFAYGGSHILDLGYFPLGNRLFTDLAHYVRSGDFVSALLEDATTVEEYAFALGALSHWVADDTGHPEATNRVVPEIYPELRKKYGDRVTYADDHSSHLQTEFRFDVLQVAGSKRPPDLFDHAIAFEVSKPVLDRAFRETYGLALDELFVDTDVAIATYRWAFRDVIHEATGIAWELYRAEIEKVDPESTPAGFVWEMSRGDFRKQFGETYREPGYFARFLGFVVTLVPQVGPLKRAPYVPLPEEAQREFHEAFDHAVARYRTAVAHTRTRDLRLPNQTLDTGQPTRPGAYEPADDAYAALLDKLADTHWARVSPALRADIIRFYEGGSAMVATRKDADDWRKVRHQLDELEASTPDRISRRP